MWQADRDAVAARLSIPKRKTSVICTPWGYVSSAEQTRVERMLQGWRADFDALSPQAKGLLRALSEGTRLENIIADGQLSSGLNSPSQGDS